MSVTEEAVFINIFRVDPADVDAVVDAWWERREVMSTMPGFIDATLYRATLSSTEFQLVNVARWATVEQFRTATKDPKFRNSFPTSGPVISTHGGLFTPSQP